jgi:hypothetical protein
MGEWLKVVEASDCKHCSECHELVCPVCDDHYADCACPGPHQDDEYEYRETDDGQLEARKL